jgi:hypothetical protein
MTAKYFFSPENKQETRLLRKIIEESDWEFTKWAIDKILQWDNVVVFPQLLHLHGDRDHIFPIKYIRNCTVLRGGHFMVVSRAKEVSEILNETFS